MVALPSPFDHSQISADAPFKQAADAYIAAGYAVVPVLPHNKAPGAFSNDRWKLMDDWPAAMELQRDRPSVIDHWKGWPDANIGIILGTEVNGYQVIAVDVDTPDEGEQDLLLSQLPPSRMRKQAHRGFTLFYRAPMDTRTKRYTVGTGQEKRTVLELLTGNSRKQTVMPPSLHPTGIEYRWYGPKSLVKACELPVLTHDDLEALEDTLRHLGWNENEPTTASGRVLNETDAEDPNIWRDVNNAALANLDAWVCNLGLPKLRRVSSGRWEGVAFWRSSSTGRPMMERKPNLSIHTRGIKDMGTQETYSAADVVMQAFSWSSEQAFDWLRERLGIKADDSQFGELTISPPRMLTEAADGTLYDHETGEVVSAAPIRIDSVEVIGGITKAANALPASEMPYEMTNPEGLLGRLTDYIEATANTPNRVIAFASALTALSTLCGRKFASPTRCGTALYVLVVGKTGCGKQHGINSLIRVLRTAKAEMTVGSPEAMSMTALVKQITDQPLSASAVDEFGQYLRRINSKRGGPHDEGIKKVMLQAWGANFNTYQTPSWANSPSKAVIAPSFSMLGMTTPTSFFSAVEGADIDNGMMNRFLMLQTDIVNEQQFEHIDAELPADLADDLCGLFLFEEHGIEVNQLRISHDVHPPILQLSWGKGAKEFYKSFVAEMNDICNNGATGDESFYARTGEMGLRIATIQSLARNYTGMVVSLEDMEYGAMIAKWSAARMAKLVKQNMSETAHQADANRILSVIEKAGGKIEMPALIRRLRNRFSSKVIKDHMTSLQEAGAIMATRATPEGGGAPKTLYFLQNQG